MSGWESGLREPGKFLLMDDPIQKALPCGCAVKVARDFLGRVVGTILTRGDGCDRDTHTLGQVVVMPGREHARPE